MDTCRNNEFFAEEKLHEKYIQYLYASASGCSFFVPSTKQNKTGKAGTSSRALHSVIINTEKRKMLKLSAKNAGKIVTSLLKEETVRLRKIKNPDAEEAEKLLLFQFLLDGYTATERDEEMYRLTNRVLRNTAKEYPSLVLS